MNKEPVTIVLNSIPPEISKSLYDFVSDILDYADGRKYTLVQSYDKDGKDKIKVRFQ